MDDERPVAELGDGSVALELRRLELEVRAAQLLAEQQRLETERLELEAELEALGYTGQPRNRAERRGGRNKGKRRRKLGHKGIPSSGSASLWGGGRG